MKDFATLRIYFEHGKKIHGHSFWKKLHAPTFDREILKRAKAFDLYQVLNFNVSKGYLKGADIQWGHAENVHFRHPQVIEIIDTESRIMDFVTKQKTFLQEANLVLVKSEIAIL
jgi:PII-like signaling protein